MGKLYSKRFDLDGSREYIKEWERLADTSKTKFNCVTAVDREGSVTSLWHGTLPNGRDLFVISIDRQPSFPQYDRGFIDRNEALQWFSRFQEGACA